MCLLTFCAALRATFTCPKQLWVIFQLLPPMALTTSILQTAAVPICFRVFLSLPTWALHWLIVVHVWSSSVVLPVMRIHTLVSQVFLVAEWTPDSLKVKQVEICVTLHLLEQRDRQFSLVMGKSAIITVLTAVDFVWVGSAKLCFVFFRVIKVLNSIVAPNAAILAWAFFVES